MTDAEIAAIAKGLSEAQRHQILLGLEGDEVSKELARLGLTWKISTHFDFNADAIRLGGWEMRRRGLAVRAYLERESHD